MKFTINLPSYDIRAQTVNGQDQIFDIIRRKFVQLTPEEWVRQHFINYLIEYKGFSRGLLAIEHPVNVNSMLQRADIVAFSREGNPVLVVECKAPSVKLSNETYAQAARYNLTLKAKLLVVTNGKNHFCSLIDMESRKFTPLNEIPHFSEIIEVG